MRHRILSFCVTAVFGVASLVLSAAVNQQVSARYYWLSGAYFAQTTSSDAPVSDPYSGWVNTTKPTLTFAALPPAGLKAVSWGWTSNPTASPLSSGFTKIATGDSCTWTYTASGNSVYLGLEMDYISYSLRYSGGSTATWCWTNEVTVADCAVQKAGYTFGGSWTNREGLAVSRGQVVTGATFGITNHNDEAIVTLFPTWTANTYALTLNAHGGTGGTTALTATYDAILPDVTVPTRTGHTFGGYWTGEDGSGACYIDEHGKGCQFWTETTETTLHAKWTEDTKYFTVNWYDDSIFGGDLLLSEKVAEGADATPPSQPRHDGYTFTGWLPSGENIRSDTDITAQYKAKRYRVYLNPHGGSGEQTSRLYTYDEEGALPDNTFTRTGYTFQGWATNSAEAVVVYADKARVFNWSTGTAVNLYAVWRANAYVVHFENGGGTGEMADQAFTYDEEKALSFNTFTNGELAFLGWRCSNGQVFKDGAVVSNLTALAGGIVTNTALWAQTYKVRFDGNGATNATAMADQVFEGPDDEKALSPNAFGKRGYAFAGWATTKGGAKVYDDGQKVKGLALAGETVTLFARWSPIVYSVAFDAGGGTVLSEMATLTATYDTSFVLPDVTGHFRAANPDLDGFGVWKDELNGLTYTNRASVSNLCAVAGATNVLKAIWALDVGPWSEHAHCTTLRWGVQEKGWGYAWLKNAGTGYGRGATGTSIGQTGEGTMEGRDWLEAVVRTNGTLRFYCRWRKGAGSTRSKVSLYAALSQTSGAFFSDGYASARLYPVLEKADEWLEVSMPVTLAEDDALAYVHLVVYTGSSEDEIEIDQIEWQPEGGSPAPVYADVDTPIGSFGVTDGRVSFAFSGKGMYHLLGTNDVTGTMPWPVVFVTNVTEGAVFSVPQGDEGAMFYRLRAVK